MAYQSAKIGRTDTEKYLYKVIRRRRRQRILSKDPNDAKLFLTKIYPNLTIRRDMLQDDILEDDEEYFA